MKNVSEYQLNDVCKLIVDCEHKTAPIQEAGYPSIRTPNIGRGRLILENVNRVSEKTYKLWTKREVPTGGDLIIAREAPVGNVAIIPDNLKVCLGQRTVLIRPDIDMVNNIYLLYLLLGDEIQGKMHSFASGATVAHLNMGDIRKLKLPPLPTLLTQQKIASILSAYDDLIKNNTRRIKILEEMAQRIYREWFVHFRFPGHEKVKMLKGVPDGWEIKQIREISSIYRGKSYRGKELVEEGGMQFLNLKNINRNGGFRYDGLKNYIGPYKENHIAKPNDIIMAVTDMTQERMIIARAARVPKIGYDEFVYSMDLVKVLPNEDINKEFLFGLFSYSTFPDEVKQYANGANVLHLSPDRISDFQFALPPSNLRNNFADAARKIFQLIDNLSSKNSNLRHTRDLLLPKLISGKIDVEDLDINTGALVA